MTGVTRLCFVCLGNIVRSPLAENMFRFLIEKAGLQDKYIVDSAGTSGWHIGEKPDRRMMRVAAGHGFEYTGQARQFQRQDLENFDYILAMDLSNYSNLVAMAKNEKQKQKIHLLREFDPQGNSDSPVPDPYFGGIDGFEDVYQIVERSCQGLVDALENGTLK